VRYGLDCYIKLRENSVFKGINVTYGKIHSEISHFPTSGPVEVCGDNATETQKNAIVSFSPQNGGTFRVSGDDMSCG
jgi:hypothetical protein